MSIKTRAGALENWSKKGCKSLDLFPSGSCVTRVARIACSMRARALGASPPAGSGAQNEAATLLWRGTTCARQHCGTLFSPRWYHISSARPAFGNLDTEHLNLLASPLAQMPQRRDFGRGGGHYCEIFAFSKRGHGAHLKVALSRKHTGASPG